MNPTRLLYTRRLAVAPRGHRGHRYGHTRWSRAGALLSACVCLFLCAPARAAHDLAPDNEIPLVPLGYESALPELLAAGSAMATVDYVDPKHILVTFGLRGLIPREKGALPTDDDRLVGAYLLELPSGKLLAQAKWHLHDRGQYLWNLGNGNFLFRVRNQLSLLTPGRAAHPQDAFEEHPFLRFEAKIVSISVSAASDLLMVQTTTGPPGNAVLGDNNQATSPPVVIGFYRLSLINGTLTPSPAGSVHASVPLALPVSADGIIEADEVKRDRWQFRFSSTSGELTDLAQFDTSCFPQTMLVSRTEFIAFGCRGSEDRADMAGFNMNGDFMWQQSYNDARFTSTFSFAPAAGRFAIGRTILNSSGAGLQSITPAEISGQEVRVYQTSSGNVLLDLNCTPAMRAGQNFALSPDGMQFAVLRESSVQHKATKLYDAYTSREAAIEIYDLPPLSQADQAALAQRHKFPPPGPMPRIDRAILAANRREQAVDTAATAPAAPAGSAANPASQPAPDASAPSASAAQPSPAAAQSSAPSEEAPDAGISNPASQPAGDLQPDQPRKPPTLYSPGEDPQKTDRGVTTPSR